MSEFDLWLILGGIVVIVLWFAYMAIRSKID